MKYLCRTGIRHALFCCMVLAALPAQAIISCTKTVEAGSEAAGESGADANRIARLLAGIDAPDASASPSLAGYVSGVNEAWKTYSDNLGRPLRGWAQREVRQDQGATVFYPFSGPDLPSILAVYPAAKRYVMISDQYAKEYFDPFALRGAELDRVVRELNDSWARFGRLGFFLTQELNKGGERKYHLGPSMILMAFAARLGYEIRAIRPICLDTADATIRPGAGRDVRWASVRLELHKDGRDIVVDYVQQDLSNRGLSKQGGQKTLIESLAKGPVLLKAASHLPQQPAFSIIRNAVLANSPLLVQDETGLEYDDMAKQFNVKLYGEYVGAYYLFKEATNASLVRAYKERAGEVKPLGFRLGYEKEIGSAIQVGTRK